MPNKSALIAAAALLGGLCLSIALAAGGPSTRTFDASERSHLHCATLSHLDGCRSIARSDVNTAAEA